MQSLPKDIIKIIASYISLTNISGLCQLDEEFLIKFDNNNKPIAMACDDIISCDICGNQTFLYLEIDECGDFKDQTENNAKISQDSCYKMCWICLVKHFYNVQFFNKLKEENHTRLSGDAVENVDKFFKWILPYLIYKYACPADLYNGYFTFIANSKNPSSIDDLHCALCRRRTFFYIMFDNLGNDHTWCQRYPGGFNIVVCLCCLFGTGIVPHFNLKFPRNTCTKDEKDHSTNQYLMFLGRFFETCCTIKEDGIFKTILRIHVNPIYKSRWEKYDCCFKQNEAVNPNILIGEIGAQLMSKHCKEFGIDMANLY